MNAIKRRIVRRGPITQSELKSAYKKTFGVSWWQEIFGLVDFKFADQTYAEADLEEMNKVIEKDQTDKQEWVSEDFDCDDHAFSLMGAFHHNRETAAMPIFITWVSTPLGGHAVLSFYKEGKVQIIEPQTDEIFDVPGNWGLILLCG